MSNTIGDIVAKSILRILGIGVCFGAGVVLLAWLVVHWASR